MTKVTEKEIELWITVMQQATQATGQMCALKADAALDEFRGRFQIGSDGIWESRDNEDDPMSVQPYSHQEGKLIWSHTTVTVKQWREFVEDTGYPYEPAIPDNDRLPITRVNYFDALAFCGWAGCRLPTGDEWTAACLAGSSGEYCCEENELQDYAVFDADGLAEVGTKRPNAWGLYDMHGNVWEWTTEGTQGGRVLRGGSWVCLSFNCRASYRYRSAPRDRFDFIGFRVVLCGQD